MPDSVTDGSLIPPPSEGSIMTEINVDLNGPSHIRPVGNAHLPAASPDPTEDGGVWGSYVAYLENLESEVERLRAEREHSYKRGFEAGREYESFGQGMERYGEEMEREDRKLINRLYRLARTVPVRWDR